MRKLLIAALLTRVGYLALCARSGLAKNFRSSSSSARRARRSRRLSRYDRFKEPKFCRSAAEVWLVSFPTRRLSSFKVWIRRSPAAGHETLFQVLLRIGRGDSVDFTRHPLRIIAIHNNVHQFGVNLIYTLTRLYLQRSQQAPYRLRTLQVGERRLCRRCLCAGEGSGSLTVARRHKSEHSLPHAFRKRLNGFQSGHLWAVGSGRLRCIELQFLDYFFYNGPTFDKFILRMIEVR